jgi:hypothetical protein
VRDEQLGIPIATHVAALRLAIGFDAKAGINRVFSAGFDPSGRIGAIRQRVAFA